MQLPSASRLRLICAPSTILLPRFCVLAARSEPARSIRNSLPTRTCWWMPVTRCRCLTETMSTACERDDVLLAAVGSWVRSLLPPFSIDITFTTQNTEKCLSRNYTVVGERFPFPPSYLLRSYPHHFPFFSLYFPFPSANFSLPLKWGQSCHPLNNTIIIVQKLQVLQNSFFLIFR